MGYFDVVQRTNVEVYGLQIVVTRAGGSATAGLRGIFQAKHQGIDADTQVPVMIDKPRLDVVLADMPGGDLAREDKIEIPVQASVPVHQFFVVVKVEKDGEGMAMCDLAWDE
jgi:hypothetical protein